MLWVQECIDLELLFLGGEDEEDPIEWSDLEEGLAGPVGDETVPMEEDELEEGEVRVTRGSLVGMANNLCLSMNESCSFWH